MVYTKNHTVHLNYPSKDVKFTIPNNIEVEGACVVVVKDSKILACSRESDYTNLGLPAGKVDPGETSFQAAIRELWEETGLSVKNMGELEDYIYYNPPIVLQEYSNIHTYIVPLEFLEGKIIEKNPEEDYVCVWTDVSNICKDNCDFADYNKLLLVNLGLL